MLLKTKFKIVCNIKNRACDLSTIWAMDDWALRLLSHVNLTLTFCFYSFERMSATQSHSHNQSAFKFLLSPPHEKEIERMRHSMRLRVGWLLECRNRVRLFPLRVRSLTVASDGIRRWHALYERVFKNHVNDECWLTNAVKCRAIVVSGRFFSKVNNKI